MRGDEETDLYFWPPIVLVASRRRSRHANILIPRNLQHKLAWLVARRLQQATDDVAVLRVLFRRPPSIRLAPFHFDHLRIQCSFLFLMVRTIPYPLPCPHFKASL